MGRTLGYISLLVLSFNLQAVQLPSISENTSRKSSPVQIPMTLDELVLSLEAYHWDMNTGNYSSLSPGMLESLWGMVEDPEKPAHLKKRVLIILSHHLQSVAPEDYVAQWRLEGHIAIQRQLLRNFIRLRAITERAIWLSLLQEMLKTDDILSKELIAASLEL